MAHRGRATLPLHTGPAPRWLFERMVDLSGAIAEVIVDEYGRDELLRRLSDPYWFQAFGCVLGFDWHSSGVTTTTMGALKQSLDPHEHGIAVVGGKGATARRTPTEIESSPLDLRSSRRGELVHASKLSAAVDNACLQDGYDLYHHTMVATDGGDWCVVQQGMNDGDGTARRYHWLSDELDSFVESPQAAICAQERRRSVLDMTAAPSDEARAISVDLVQDDPDRLKRYLYGSGQRTLTDFASGAGQTETEPIGPHLRMPTRHDLRLSDLSERSIDRLRIAYEYQPDDYEELIGLDGIGPGSIRALALIAELVYDARSSRTDPAKFAWAHGGKDGTPHPVRRDRYDRSIEFLRSVLDRSAADGRLKQTALTRLARLE